MSSNGDEPKIVFCENCDNYCWYSEDNVLKYTCYLCETELVIKKTDNNCVHKQNYDKSSLSLKTYMHDNMLNDPTLFRINDLDCINKNCPTITQGKDKEIVYIKYSKEDLKFIYCCTVCKTKWSNSETKN